MRSHGAVHVALFTRFSLAQRKHVSIVLGPAHTIPHLVSGVPQYCSVHGCCDTVLPTGKCLKYIYVVVGWNNLEKAVPNSPHSKHERGIN